MTKPILYFLTAIFLAGLLTGCVSDSKSEVESFYFEGDIRTLLIQKTEVPPGWPFYRASSDPQEDMIAELGVVYASNHTLMQRATLITHGVGAYKTQEVAMERFDYSYEDYFEPIVDPPKEYRYQSPLADEFKIICTSIT